MSAQTAKSKFKRVRAVTLPVLKLEKGKPRYVYMLGALHSGKKIDDQKEAATLIHAVDMETGEEGLIICPAIMVKELQENYPGESYVRKGFEVILTRVPEKRYNLVSLTEVAPPDDFTPPTVAAPADPAAAKPAKK